MMSDEAPGKTAALLILAAMSVIILMLAAGSVRRDSATADEPAHIAGGYEFLMRGRLDFFPEQPPLMESLLALPIVVAGHRFPPIEGNPWFVGHEDLYNSGHDAHRLLMLARIPAICLLLGLCFAVYAFVARHSGSRRWGLIAFAMTGLCPNLLAHGRLATVDIGATFFIFAAAALFILLLEEPTIARGAGCGALVAAAALTKVSALIIGPFFVLLLIVKMIRRDLPPWRPLFAALATSAVVALITFMAVFVAIDRRRGETSLITPFTEYRQRIDAVRRGYSAVHQYPQFLLGHFSGEGWPQYYVVALALKTPIGAQVLFLAAVVAGVRRRASFPLQACLLFVALFLAASMRSHIALGLRYVLPIFPFIYASVALAFAELMREPSRHRRPLAIAATVLIAWHAASGIAAYPGYISYFNETVSLRHADRYLIDSNLDWGQDLLRLRRWCDAKSIDVLRIHYFGGGDPATDLGSRAVIWRGPQADPLPRGWFALSRHPYRLSFLPRLSPENYDDYLRRSHARYVRTIGGSIYVYRVE